MQKCVVWDGETFCNWGKTHFCRLLVKLFLPDLGECQCTVDFEVQKLTEVYWEQSGVITLLLQN